MTLPDDLATQIAGTGLERAGARPPLAKYSRDLWGRRHFVIEFSRAKNAVGYSRSFLGQAWQLLTPALNAGVYFLIFGVLVPGFRKGIHDYIAYLVIGVFTFTFMQQCFMLGSQTIHSNLGLTRVLHFPRAVLPLSSMLTALQQLLFSMFVMIPIVLLTGEPLTWKWLLLPVALVLLTLFCLGVTFGMARIGAKIPDTSQALPFILRTWMYLSGVLYSVQQIAKSHAHWVLEVMQANPGNVYISLVRDCLLHDDGNMTRSNWAYAIFWALFFSIGGYIFFWRAEEQYGRV